MPPVNKVELFLAFPTEVSLIAYTRFKVINFNVATSVFLLTLTNPTEPQLRAFSPMGNHPMLTLFVSRLVSSQGSLPWSVVKVLIS